MPELLKGGSVVSRRRWGQFALNSGLRQEANGGQLKLPWNVGWGRFTETDMKVSSDAKTASLIKRRIHEALEEVRD